MGWAKRWVKVPWCALRLEVLASNSHHNLRGQKLLFLCYHTRHLQQNSLLCGMYGFTAKSSVATLKICQILMRLEPQGSNIEMLSFQSPFHFNTKMMGWKRIICIGILENEVFCWDHKLQNLFNLIIQSFGDLKTQFGQQRIGYASAYHWFASAIDHPLA